MRVKFDHVRSRATIPSSCCSSLVALPSYCPTTTFRLSVFRFAFHSMERSVSEQDREIREIVKRADKNPDRTGVFVRCVTFRRNPATKSFFHNLASRNFEPTHRSNTLSPLLFEMLCCRSHSIVFQRLSRPRRGCHQCSL